jgi:hypothetical protein
MDNLNTSADQSAALAVEELFQRCRERIYNSGSNLAALEASAKHIIIL